MSAEEKEWLNYLIFGAFWFLVCGLFAFVPSPAKPAPDQRHVSTHCRLVSKADTGQRRYCGKACFQTVYAYTYQCPGTVVVLDT